MRDLKWEALRNLSSTADFNAASVLEYKTALAWAKDKKNDFTKADACAVANAWFAVGVGPGDVNCDGVLDPIPDPDGDYIPTPFDNCPFNANPKQEDKDGDGIGDVCDNCKNTFNGDQTDTDGDGIGDACDNDIDGDGCPNAFDDDPNSAKQKIGTRFCVFTGDDPIYGWAGDDTDHDGRRNCEDDDDDGDGIPDNQDGCPAGNLAGALQGTGCRILEDCPASRNDWWRVCVGGGCVEFYATFKDVINPNPEQNVIVDKVTVVNQKLYLSPNQGVSAAQTAKAIANIGAIGRAGLRARVINQPSLIRVELWQRATANEPAHLVAVVGDFDPAALNIDQVGSGSMLVFNPGDATNPPKLASIWHVLGDTVDTNLDSDGDGLPDGWELQYGLDPNKAGDQLLDTDGDGMTNLQDTRRNKSTQAREPVQHPRCRTPGLAGSRPHHGARWPHRSTRTP